MIDFPNSRNVIMKRAIVIKKTIIYNNFTFFIPIKVLGHIIWYAMDK
jgi:hypothetical protein